LNHLIIGSLNHCTSSARRILIRELAGFLGCSMIQ
jgi:hypothetical protein